MSSRGAWCKAQGCLNHVDASLGWGEYNRCNVCRGYYCQNHLFYTPNFPTRMCPDCLEGYTQARIAANAR